MLLELGNLMPADGRADPRILGKGDRHPFLRGKGDRHPFLKRPEECFAHEVPGRFSLSHDLSVGPLCHPWALRT
jgi:hypothetical protein